MHCLVPHNVECTMYTMHLKTPKCPPIPLSNTVFCSVEHGEHIAWYQTLKLYTLLCSIHFLPCMEYDTFMFLLLWALWQCSFSSITGQAPLCWSPCATSLSRYLLKKGVANFIQRQKRVADIVQMCQYCVDDIVRYVDVIRKRDANVVTTSPRSGSYQGEPCIRWHWTSLLWCCDVLCHLLCKAYWHCYNWMS